MRMVFRVCAVVSLIIILVAPVLYWAEVTAESTNQAVLLVASIGWFAFALSSRRSKKFEE